jgi:predicted nuclease of restriction endonuclease-like (RecB) superfamily
MKKFYESYRDDSIVAPLVRQLPWTHNLIILEQSKRSEERGFYLKLAIQENWSKRELERQFKTALFERIVLKRATSPTLENAIWIGCLDCAESRAEIEMLGLAECQGLGRCYRVVRS